MAWTEVLTTNLLSPLTLCFALGVLVRRVRSEFALPKEMYQGIAIYLLFALGLKGGVELSHASFANIAKPALATLLLGCITPLTTYFVLRRLGRFSTSDAAGIAAHYGSVSAVTYIAANNFVTSMGISLEGFMPTLLALMETPGIQIALAIGAFQAAEKGRSFRSVLHEILTGRTMVLLVGGLLIGAFMDAKYWDDIKGFYDTKGSIFRGALCLFLLEMGVVAGDRLGDLKKVGAFLLAFGMIVPLIHGLLGVSLGVLAGLSVGGCTVLGTMAASASYIAAPPAVRITLPEANPTYSLTCALAITFPFNIVAGIPLYYQCARYLAGA
ncbi:MAG: sodium-dependent bicarbonate transport family permease [Gemmataceae bacterium]|nr:sodium-dependent bicarbonate transport family permease [Gemmataceae bacterium]